MKPTACHAFSYAPRLHRARVVGALLTAIFTSALIFASCTPGGSRRPSTPDSQESALAVDAPPIEPTGIRRTISVNGEIEALSSVDVLPASGGELIEILVGVGDRVARDQVVARVDPSRPGQVFTPSPVRAPISGTVTRLSARVGAQVSTQSPIARIATTDRLQIVTPIPERFIEGVAIDQQAIVRFDAFPSREYEARVSRLAPVVDPQARTLETILSLTAVDSRVRPGLFARVEIVLVERPAALTVPGAAIVQRDGDPHVYIANPDSGRATLRRVTTGIESDGRVEVRSGVEEGERVVIRGQNLLDDGALVRIIGTDDGDQ